MNDLEGALKNEESEELSLVAFKFGETPFSTRNAFYNDTTDQILTIAWLFYLIRYKEHNILVDTGIGSRDAFSRYGFNLDKFCEPINLLRDYGLMPDEITDVIITHSDFDHIGDINYYKKANIYIHENEYEICRNSIENVHKVVTFSTFLKVYNKLNIEYIGGHTVGSSIVTFKYGQSDYVLAGDECYIDASLEKQIPTGRSYDIARSRGFIEKYNKPNYEVLFCHEPSVVKGDPGYKVIL